MSPRWYTIALLTAPLLWVGIQGALSLTSGVYVPGIVTADDKATLLMTTLVAGLVAGLLEEIAWTCLRHARSPQAAWSGGNRDSSASCGPFYTYHCMQEPPTVTSRGSSRCR